MRTEYKIMAVMWFLIILGLNVDLGQVVYTFLAFVCTGFVCYNLLKIGVLLRRWQINDRRENGKKD